jgi:hypothetical protein
MVLLILYMPAYVRRLPLPQSGSPTRSRTIPAQVRDRVLRSGRQFGYADDRRLVFGIDLASQQVSWLPLGRIRQ